MQRLTVRTEPRITPGTGSKKPSRMLVTLLTLAKLYLRRSPRSSLWSRPCGVVGFYVDLTLHERSGMLYRWGWVPLWGWSRMTTCFELKTWLPDPYFSSLFFLKYILGEWLQMSAVYFSCIFNAKATHTDENHQRKSFASGSPQSVCGGWGGGRGHGQWRPKRN